ncbi:hypothetical protein KJ570_03350 [Patescibacteria group bacterium]|nr:hypothetical protein [Patescibacteria group bacterium]MBU2036166.1 hypothetical protein [Patescibacteria group bacterium]
MRKILFSTFLILFLFGLSVPVKAEILTLKKDGEIIINVLSYQDIFGVVKNESLEIKDVLNSENSEIKEKILLAKENGEYKLNILSNEGSKELNVTNIKGDLIEIEERPSVRNLKIGLKEGNFYLEEAGIVAVTNFPINIDSKNAEISVKTDSGEHFIAVSPVEAYQYVLRAKNISKLTGEDIVITERNLGEITYEIPGEKTLNFFGLVNYDVPVKVSVSTLTGEITNLDTEVWMRVLNFFFG